MTLALGQLICTTSNDGNSVPALYIPGVLRPPSWTVNVQLSMSPSVRFRITFP